MSDLQPEQFNQGNTIEQMPFGTIQHNLSDIMPSASELGQLWSSYFAECMSVCFLKYFVAKSKDPDIHAVLQRALDVSSQRIQTMEEIYNSINHPIPEAYGEKDVEVSAKRLFSESFTLNYTRLMHKFVMINYSYAMGLSSRSDFRSYFNGCIDTSQEIHQEATELLLQKGLLMKSPIIEIPDRVDFVHDKAFLGSMFFGTERPLNAIEISHLVSLMETKQLLRALILGYSQTIESEKIKNFIQHALKISSKQLSKLGSFLNAEFLPEPTTIGNFVTTSTESPQSDKLVLSHVIVTIAYIISEFGISLTNTARKDLAATYSNFTVELLSLAKDGTELMIESGWLERVPEAADRKKLMS